MTYIRSEVRTLCRSRLSDTDIPYKFSDDQLNQWINDAIADYSNYFPRRQTTVITCVAADCQYDLPEGCRAVVKVEFPTGENPPVYLLRRNRDEANFVEGPYYDLIEHNQAGYPPELLLGQTPSAGQEITVDYEAVHAWMDDDSDTCTVIDEHLEAILLYVRWATFQELASQESANPDPESMAISILELNAYRAERAYRKTIEDYGKMQARSAVTSWTMDKWDKTY